MKRPMFIPPLLSVLMLLVPLTTPFALGQQKAAEQVKPLLSETTFCVVHVDLSRIDLDAMFKTALAQIDENLEKLYTEEETRDQFREMYQMQSQFLLGIVIPYMKTLTEDAAVSDAFFVFDTELFESEIPFFLAIPLEGKTTKQQEALGKFFQSLKTPAVEFPIRFKRHGFYFMIPGEPDSPYMPNNEQFRQMIQERKTARQAFVRERFKELAPAPRTDFPEGIADLKDYPIQIVFAENPMFLESIPELPWDEVPFLAVENEDEEAEDDGFNPLIEKIKKCLTSGISWTGLGLYPEKQKATWIVRASSANAGKEIAQTTDEVAERFAQWMFEEAKYRGSFEIGKVFDAPKDLKDTINVFLPKLDASGQRLVLNLDKAYFVDNDNLIFKPILRMTQQAKDDLKRFEGFSNLKQLGLAIHVYHDVRGTLPPAWTVDESGKPLHSWRVLLLPYIEEQGLYDEIRHDEPWDSEFNKQFHSQIPGIYREGSFFNDPKTADAYLKNGWTHVTAVTGKEAIFEGDNTRLTLANVPDGTSNTLLFAQRTKPVCWMDPKGDVPFEIAIKGINKDPNGLGMPGSDGIKVTICDGSVRFFPETLDPEDLRAILTKNGGESTPVPDWSFDSRPLRPAPMKKRLKTANTQLNMKQIALAMHNYHDAHKSFPALYRTDKETKKPLHSWRATLLPYIEEVALYEAIRWDEPWDSEYNKQFHDKMPETYRGTAVSREEADQGLTTICVVHGEKAFFQADKWKGMPLLVDGTSNTIMLAQRKTPFCWMDPEGDIPFELVSKGMDKDDKGLGAPDQSGKEKGAYFGFFDGSVLFLPLSTKPETLENYFRPNDGK